jgi:hypothetical protein
METKDSVRYWAGVVGAVAVVAGILAVVVMVRMPAPKKTAQQTQPTKTAPQSAAKAAPSQKSQPQAKSVAAIRPVPAAKPTANATPAAATNALTEAERKTSEELYIETKKLDTDSARVVAAAPEGRRRVAEMIAKQFSVPEKMVTDLRARKLSWGEVTATLAASQQLMKHDKISRQQAIDRILTARKSGQGWAALSRGFGLKVADLLSDVKKTDKQVAKLVLVKASR